MGGAVSTGRDNDDLINNLLDADYIKTPEVERVFRAVDRASYYLPDHRDTAYRDLAWKHGHLHLSAPCIYSEVMESLKLEKGLSFLNLGSGTGYLSTMVGLVIGPYAWNHGVELHEDVVEYARERLEEFKRTCVAFDEFEFSEPVFVSGNCLLLNTDGQLYDRVYCGASCPPEHENYMKNLIKIGGVLVIPINDQLSQIVRTGENTWESHNVLPVSFASLMMPSKETGLDMVDLPKTALPSLQDICRINIRSILKSVIVVEHPEVYCRHPRKTKPKPSRRRHINIVPMSMGMMILGQLEGNGEEGQSLTLHTDDEEEDMSDCDSDVQVDDIDQDCTERPPRAKPSVISLDGNKWVESQNNGQETSDKNNTEEQVVAASASGVSVKSNKQPEKDRLGRRSRHRDIDSGRDSSSDESTDEQADVDILEMFRRSDLGLRESPPRKVRCSSSTSADTSETSGICTVSDHSDESIGKPSPDGHTPPIMLPPKAEGHMEFPQEDNKPRLKYYLKEKISILPIPSALKGYLTFYRN